MVEEGRAEMRAARTVISSVPCGPFYTDDLSRTSEAAGILAEDAAKPEVVVLRGLRPWGVGTKLSGQIKTKSLERLVEWYVANPNVVPEGDEAESINESIVRWNSAFSYVLSQTKPGIASVISCHSNAHKILRQQFLGQKYKGNGKAQKFKLGHGGVMTFRLRKDGNANIGIIAQGRLEDSERATIRIAELRSVFKRQVEISPDFIKLCNQIVVLKYDDPKRREILLAMGQLLGIPNLPEADVMSVIGTMGITHVDGQIYMGEIEDLLTDLKLNPSEKSPLK